MAVSDRLSALLLLMPLSLAGGASAQTDAGDAVSAGQPSEIIVTAQKRLERAQDVPETVSALSGETLAQFGAKDLLQAVTLVPGVIFSRAPDDGLALTFRGLGTLSRSQELEQSIALIQDGVPFAKGRLYTTSFFDTQQMEFVKGTESTLFGKNSSFGVISVASNPPTGREGFSASAGYEALDGGYLLDAAGDMPVGDKAALHVAVHYNDLDGWVHDDATDHNGPEQRDAGVRAILRINAANSATVTALYQYADNQQIGASMQLVGNIPPSEGDGVLNDHNDLYTGGTDDHETHHDTRTHILSLKEDWRLGSQTLTAQTAFIHYDLYFTDDMDFSPDNTVNFLRDEHYNQVSQEVRLQSPSGGRFDYIVGSFFLASHWSSSEDQLWAVPSFPPPPAPTSGQLFNGPFTNHFDEDALSFSTFASGGWRITPKLKLAAGVRLSHEVKDDLYGRTNAAPLTIWNTISNPPFDPTPLHHHANFFDGDASLQYALATDILGYVSYGHGSKAGGFVETNTIAVPPAELVAGKVPAGLVSTNAFIKDEVAQTYEVGVKSELFDRRLRLNLAGFVTNIHNYQDTVFTGGTLGFITFNDPVRSVGFEVDSGLALGRGFSIDGGLTYADATQVIQPIDPLTNAPEVNAAGKPIMERFQRSQAPKVVLNLGAAYQTRLANGYDAHLNANLHFRSSMYNQRQDEYYSPALTTLDLSAGFRPPQSPISFDVVAKNITNAISQDFASATVDPRFSAFYGAYAASPNRLRTVMMTISVKY